MPKLVLLKIKTEINNNRNRNKPAERVLRVQMLPYIYLFNYFIARTRIYRKYRQRITIQKNTVIAKPRASTYLEFPDRKPQYLVLLAQVPGQQNIVQTPD